MKNSIEIERHLEGINFPTSREDLLHQAIVNNVSDDILHLLDCLPEQEYGRPADVNRELSEIVV